jgi:hypothetical protein
MIMLLLIGVAARFNLAYRLDRRYLCLALDCVDKLAARKTRDFRPYA